MKLLIVHLSDIHVKGATDPVLARGDSIARAAKSVADDVDLTVILTTGDVAFAGKKEQYEAAEPFFASVATSLERLLAEGRSASHVRHVVVPGNHDCLFPPGEARNVIVDEARSKPAQAKDASVVKICTDAQEEFFAFRARLAGDGWSAPGQYDQRLYYEYEFTIKDERVRFLCCNTAWLSKLREEQGSLLFPSDAIPLNATATDGIRIAAFHHPDRWHQHVAGRAFSKALQSCVDVVFTGHEHDPDQGAISRASGANNVFVEGGVLQDSDDPNNSSFNVLVLDTVEKKQLFIPFAWNGEHYARDDESDGPEGPAWEEFRLNRLRKRGALDFNERTHKWLDDPELNISDPRGVLLRLSQIYEFPDLREFSMENVVDQKSPLVRSEHLLGMVSRGSGLLVFTGDTQAGKTSLCKTLMLRLLENGDIPIMIRGSASFLRSTSKQVSKALEDAFAEQYETGSRELYRQAPRERLVLIIDDYHDLKLTHEQKKKLLDDLCKKFGRIVLTGHDMMLGMEALTSPDATIAVTRHKIQPFGMVRRNRLVTRWLMLANNSDARSAEFTRNLNTVMSTLDTLIGKNFVPAYPPYVLAVLQATEAGTPVDLRASTHGYFFELFIKAALARGTSNVQFDVLMTYLTYTAYEFFRSGVKKVSVAKLRSICDAYLEHSDATLDFDKTMTRLVEQRIFELSDDEIGFQYSYVFYYFVANHLHRQISQPGIREQIHTLAQSLHVEEHANIMLFLAHLTGDSIVVDEMVSAAENTYKEMPSARLDDDVAFLGDLGVVVEEVLVFLDREPSVVREEVLEALDRASELPASSGSVVTVNPTDPITRLGMALKTLQILGQLAKNFPGSMDGATKMRIVRECYDLGLRTISWLLSTMKLEQLHLLTEFAEIVKSEHPLLTSDSIMDRAQNALVSLAHIGTFGIVKRVAAAVGSPDLLKTYAKTIDRSIPAEQLINLSIGLDHLGTFPMADLREAAEALKTRPMAARLLRSLLRHHLSLFPTALSTKQQACAVVGMKYEQLEQAAVELKFLTK